jgi:ATP-dependent RNA helicase RhlE
LKPTPIQDEAIPHALGGRDVVGIANTGTGKTAAFLLPLLDKVIKNRNERILIMAPTRELAQQINEEFRGFEKGLKIFSVLCIGGASIGMQIRSLRMGYNFIIGTPGRIKDLHKRKAIDLSRFQNVVLDEADRMLDMGFLPDIKFLLGLLPEKRQTLFFSATISKDIEGLINNFLRDPITISVKKQDTSANVKQDVVKIGTGRKRIDLLEELLDKPELKKVLVFGKTKHGVEKITTLLEKKGHRVASLHGNKSQAQRMNALKSFKENKVRVLVATDVAARGLDIDNVSHVINFDPPATYDDYVHRIGRTGRADKQGIALTFVD